MSRYFTAANFDRYIIMKRNALRDQGRIMETEERKAKKKFTCLFQEFIFIYIFDNIGAGLCMKFRHNPLAVRIHCVHRNFKLSSDFF